MREFASHPVCACVWSRSDTPLHGQCRTSFRPSGVKTMVMSLRSTRNRLHPSLVRCFWTLRLQVPILSSLYSSVRKYFSFYDTPQESLCEPAHEWNAIVWLTQVTPTRRRTKIICRPLLSLDQHHVLTGIRREGWRGQTLIDRTRDPGTTCGEAGGGRFLTWRFRCRTMLLPLDPLAPPHCRCVRACALACM